MRAIGATHRDIRRAYLYTAALLGLLGSALGTILAIGLAWLLTGVFARAFFGVSPGFSVDWPVAVASSLAGLAGTVLIAWPMLRRPLRTPVREALATEGLASGFGRSRLDRALLHSGALPAPVRVGIRDVARRNGHQADGPPPFCRRQTWQSRPRSKPNRTTGCAVRREPAARDG